MAGARTRWTGASALALAAGLLSWDLRAAPLVIWLSACGAGLLTLSAAAQERQGDGKETVVFRYDPRPAGAERVCLAGEFNGWDEDACALQRDPDGVFRVSLRLDPGVYRYKFVVDGDWRPDPRNPLREPDGFHNSVLVVGDVDPPDLRPGVEPDPHPRPRQARPGAFLVIPAEEVPPPPTVVRPRPLYVYLPPSYEAEPERRFPVLYLHDGQNVWSDPEGCFGHGGWSLDATADRLWAQGRCEQFVLVGVPNTADRMEEYTCTDLLRAERDAYLRYLVEVVKPFVDQRFRTRPGPEDTALMGSSLGGLCSFVFGLTRPDVFGKVACLSSSFWFEDAYHRSAFDVLEARGAQPVRIYLDSGTAGPSQDGAPDTRRMAQALRDLGWDDATTRHVEDEGAEHNETAWRGRAAEPLRFLFGVR